MKEDQMTDLEQFETTSIHLAAAVLTSIPTSHLASITPNPTIDGKRLIVIQYPLSQQGKVKRLAEDFHARRLTVPLYAFNRALNLLRDRLLQDRHPHAVR